MCFRSTLKTIAIAFPDYVPVDTIVNIPIGSLTGSTFCIDVTIIDDNILELTEQFFLDLVTITPNSLIVQPQRAVKTVTILDNERKISTKTNR